MSLNAEYRGWLVWVAHQYVHAGKTVGTMAFSSIIEPFGHRAQWWNPWSPVVTVEDATRTALRKIDDQIDAEVCATLTAERAALVVCDREEAQKLVDSL